MGRKASGTAYEKPKGSGVFWLSFLLRDKTRYTRRVPGHPDGRPLTLARAKELKDEAVRRYELGLWDPKAPPPVPQAPAPVLTLADYATRWSEALDHSSADNERRCVEQRIAPSTLGAMPLAVVRPPDVAAWIKELRKQPSTKGGLLAPVTVRSFVGVLRRLYTQACFEGLAAANPCILPRGKLPAMRDKVPEARATWRFYREEIVELISEVSIPLARRVVYALLFLTGMRASELVVMRWRDYDATVGPLGRLTIARAMKRIRPKRTEPRQLVIGGTKTEVAKYVPTHPTLGAMLAEWKLGGWAAIRGRAPKPDDLIAPSRNGKARSAPALYLTFQRDLVALGIRRRRMHGARHTFISLAIDDGARPDLIRQLTHPRPVGGDTGAFEGYRNVAWETLCAEVEKINVRRRGDVLPLWRKAAGGEIPHESDSATHSTTGGQGGSMDDSNTSVSDTTSTPSTSEGVRNGTLAGKAFRRDHTASPDTEPPEDPPTDTDSATDRRAIASVGPHTPEAQLYFWFERMVLEGEEP